MSLCSCAFAAATRDDVPGILDLQNANLRSRGSGLSIRFSREWFERAITQMPVVVARSNGRVVGYVISTPLTAQAHDPIIRAMLAAYPGSRGAYNYGPICVAKDHRGRGLAAALLRQLQSRLPNREGLTFIRADNTASRNFHQKM